VAESAATGRVGSQSARFAATKFRPPALPATLVTRSALHDRLKAGAEGRLTVVVGSAGAGKSVLLSSWAAARSPGVTSWLSCDKADANPVRFWTGFIEAPRAVVPEFGADAADLLAMDAVVSADVTASLANDAAKLPAGSAVVVDDYHYAAPEVSGNMADLVQRWPAGSAQLVLSSRVDPALRLHRLRMSGELCELRDRDLYFSLAESGDLLANFGVKVAGADLAVLYQRSEGWAAALQMAALSLRGAREPARVARALEVRTHGIAEYFIAEVLDQQPPEVARFMLDTSVLGELTAGACEAVTGRQDAAVLLRSIDAASLFLVALDDERTSFRYHNLVRQMLRAELRARDGAREQMVQLRAAEWFESAGDGRRASRHFLAARQPGRALALLEDRVMSDFLRDPAQPPPPDLSMVDPALLAEAPDRLLALAADLLLSGDTARGGEYLDLLERAQPPIEPESRLGARFAVMRSVRLAETGQPDEAVGVVLAARTVRERTLLSDEWIVAAQPPVLLRAYTWLEDYEAVEREAAAALAAPALAEPVKLVQVRGARALAWFEYGHLAQAADAARTAEAEARRLGFDQHFFAVDHLRALAGLALERRDLDTAEQLAEQALSISERRRPAFEFLALLDRARIWACRGQVRGALATVETARSVLAGMGSVLLARADELEAVLRLSLGDLRSPAELASGLPAVRRGLLLAKVALASGDHHAAREGLQALAGDLTSRRALERQILLAAAAIERGDPMATGVLSGVLDAARRGGFLNTVVTTAPQVTGYVAGHSAQLLPGPFTDQLIGAALQVRAAESGASRPGRGLIEPLTAAEERILQLLPTSTYLQMAAILCVSRNTVKTHLRSVYQKLGVASRSEAIQRAIDLRLL
jgi:LuxR family transcriptional regulator, maltose regulon positive regulatory protein